MKKLLITSTVIAFAIFSNSSLLAKSVLEKSLNMQSDDLTSFRVDATAGDLVIEGVEGLMEIQVSAKIHGDNIEKILETYELMSQKYFTHATPTLFNVNAVELSIPSVLRAFNK